MRGSNYKPKAWDADLWGPFPRGRAISAQELALDEENPGMGYSEDYADGYTSGREWAEADRAAGLGEQSHWLQVLREESDIWREYRYGTQRAFYLGALRGYRDAVRTLRAGRWGI